MSGWRRRTVFQMLESASLSLNAADVAQMDREFMYFGHNAQTA